MYQYGRIAALTIGAAIAGALSPGLQTNAMTAEQVAALKRRPRPAPTLAYPRLNRSRRHPPAYSYKHAAQISLALGERTDPHVR